MDHHEAVHFSPRAQALEYTWNSRRLFCLEHALREATWLRPQAVLSFVSLSLCFAAAAAAAQQQTAATTVSVASLPEAPLQQNIVVPSTSTEGSASVSGVVLDASGASVAGARVLLTGSDGSQPRVLTSGANGQFVFAGLRQGSYLIMVNAPGLAPFRSDEIKVKAQQAYTVPEIRLPIAMASTDVLVLPTEVIAAQQIKAAEKQRVFGVIPNYYTSYVYDAAPLTTKQKFSLASHDTFDPVSFLGIGISAGIEQANNTYAGYGKGAGGYGKRYAAQLGDSLTSDFLSHAVFPALFHQDPRYFYQGSGSFKSRFVHAVSFAILTRGDSGHLMPNYSYFLGDIGSGALSNLYYPHADRGAGLVFTNAAIGIAGKAGGAVVREFLSKRVTTNVPGTGKP